ncbi:hypothetical protein [Streptomyces sp. XD-27]|uniref:hypothetical protein n=1 Tax=Streptomyces sp. XD-27 TaxID=3062779 RepID=UPI0026F45876|nr:hypothetical protein [Streptomyces sp. XD-27]WKX72965.1 hypothetical protein Q3Y56_26435 [Streptomyces sp. XD-27]
MARWGLIVEVSERRGEGRSWSAYVMGYVDGTREQALRELEAHARRRFPPPSRWTKRTQLFRAGDALMLITERGMHNRYTRFTVAELLYDSDAPPASADPRPPAADLEPAPEPEAPEPGPLDGVPDEARFDDGVPVKPSWLGRTDLS